MNQELDDLKSIWKGNKPFDAKPAEEIATMLKGRSNSPIAKLKRSTWFELLLTLTFGLGLLVYSFTLSSGALKWSLLVTLVLFMAYCIYYLKKIRLLNRFDPSQQTIRENLVKLINDLNAYLTFYKISYSVLFPSYFFLVLILTAIERGADAFWNQLSQPQTIVRLLIVSFIFIAITVFISKWYLKKLYGNHIETLKDLLHDINDSSSQLK
jgi:glucan phosphoethanolaminetransferase (alkaline phosphatase superfamily)